MEVQSKYGSGRPRLDLLTLEALEEIARAAEYGTRKYAAWDWLDNAMPWADRARAVISHTMKWLGGENLDPESGLSHLAHAGCNIMFLLTYEKRKLGLDNRYKSPDVSK